MKLVQLNVSGVPRFGDRRLRFLQEHAATTHQVTLITGAPRSGKTSLLRAIAAAKEAVGAYGAAPHPIDLVGPTDGGKLDTCWSLSPLEQATSGEGAEVAVSWDLQSGDLPEVSPRLRALFATFDRRPDRSKFELFSARRLIDAGRASPLLPPVPPAVEATLRLRDTGAKYGSLFRALNDATAAQATETATLLEQRGVAFRAQLPDHLALFKEATAKMCPALRLANVELRDRLRPLIWFHTKEGGRVELAHLSDSELQGFLLAATFIWLGLHRSVVLIDTPELHVHPADQARFFRSICELGADNQIIAATTSPAILDSVPPEQIVDLSKPPEQRP